MFIQETAFKGFKTFSEQSFSFSSFRSDITLGPREGRTSFREALLSAFLPFPVINLRDQISSGQNEASINLKFVLNSLKLTIFKSWTKSSITQWSVSSESFKKYNLLIDHDRLVWLTFFLKETVPDQLNSIEGYLNEPILQPLYAVIINLAAGESSAIPERMANSDFRAALSGMDAAVYLADRSKSLQIPAKTYDEENRQAWSRAAYHKKQSDDLKREHDALTSQIQSFNENFHESEATLEKLRSDLKQQERIRLFIREKQNETEKINFEISTFESLLNESFAGFSPEEFKAIELKKKKYDELERRISDLEGKIIERQHLEKNLNGLTAELETLQNVNDGQNETAKRKRTYETEIRRIQDNLRSLTGAESELQAVRDELNVYVQDHHQYEVLLKARDWMNQNDRKKIKTSITRAKKQKQDIENELADLQGEPFEKKTTDLQKQIHSTEQSLIQIRLTLNDLNDRQKKISALFNPSDGTDIENSKTPLMSVSRYLKTFETYFVQHAEKASEQAFTGFIQFASLQFSKIKSNMAENTFVDRINDQFVVPDSAALFSRDVSFSDSELLFRNLIIRVFLIRYFTNMKWIFFDEHVNTELQSHEINALLEYCERNDFEQVMFFKKS